MEILWGAEGIVMSKDEEQLRVLSIFHYVVGALAAVFGFFPTFHLIMGLVFIAGGIAEGGEAVVLSFMGFFFVLFALTFMLCAWSLAVVVILGGRYLSQRRHYRFCMFAGGAACLFMPFGTVLGVFTILVLNRTSVRELFVAENLSRQKS